MKIGRVLANWRIIERLSVEQAAREFGLAPDTYRRVEQGDSMNGKTLRSILNWMMSDD
jgi:transcriptional regulator with XRE-family HTH domain